MRADFEELAANAPGRGDGRVDHKLHARGDGAQLFDNRGHLVEIEGAHERIAVGLGKDHDRVGTHCRPQGIMVAVVDDAHFRAGALSKPAEILGGLVVDLAKHDGVGARLEQDIKD